ncbi:MAG: ATP-binding protein [Kiritimatiellia bacterium]|jgi:two-component system phosphate regulon sensor histidine kinase PhoR
MTTSTAPERNAILRHLFKLNLITAVALGVFVGFIVWIAASSFLYDRDVDALRTRILLISELGITGIEDRAAAEQSARDVVARLSRKGEWHIAIAFADGEPIGDVEAAEAGGRFEDRHEVVAARRKGEGISRRYSADHGKTMLYLARQIPGGDGGTVIRVAVPVANLASLSRSDILLLFGFGALLAVIVLAASYSSAARAVGPIADIEKGLHALGAGEPMKRLPLMSDAPHMNLLITALNSAADHLDEKIASLESERAFSSMVLASIPSGIVALTDDLQIKTCNAAAARLLGLDPPGSPAPQKKRGIENLEVVDMLYRASGSGEPVAATVRFGAAGRTLVDAIATPMHDRAGQRTGLLLLLSDTTRLRKLETIRQEFVGNVAHELRTPVTSILGFTELLARTAPEDEQARAKYAAIIMRQARQMDAIVNDLLLLASLEGNGERLMEEELAPTSIAGVIAAAQELCHQRLEETGAEVVVDCPEDLEAVILPGLVEQAVANLLDNAAKYGLTEKSKRIDISAAEVGGVVEIRVTDYGNGIPTEHLDRMFERFYRVDKGRARALGGSGLGLAIVKHIAQIHGGDVAVQSRRGERTTFILRLPSRRPPPEE